MTARSSRAPLALCLCLVFLGSSLLTAAEKSADKKTAAKPFEPPGLYASTYKPLPSRPTLITNAMVLTAAVRGAV